MFSTDLPRAVLGFVGVHLGLRAEVPNIERLYDADDVVKARQRAALLATVLHHHHQAEDTVLFPALVARHPGLVVTTDELEAQHTELDAVLAGLPDDLATAGRVRDLLDRHLHQEEQLVLPTWLSSFTAAEHERFTSELRRATPLRDAGLMISWLLDTAPGDAVDLARTQVPPSLRLLHRIWWRRRYERAFGSSGTPTRPFGTPAVAVAA
jgi:iron-sulfur cluster repair protein YtfE (RIC family)